MLLSRPLAFFARDSVRFSQCQAARKRPRARALLDLERLEERRVLSGDIHSIKHIIIIFQENASFDEYFGTYPGAEGFPMVNGRPSVSVPDPATGKMVSAYENTTDNVPVDPPHGYADAIADINGGAMNGFLHNLQPGQTPDAMNYFTQAEIPNYWAYAKNFVLQDHMFTPVPGWSLPSHMYLVSGWSATSADPNNPMSSTDDPIQPGTINRPNGNQELYAWTDLTYLMHARGVSWNYFTDPGNANIDGDQEFAPGVWNPLPGFTDVHQDNQLDNITSSDNFFTDAAAGTLPNVSWVVPNARDSEHSPWLVSDGQAWVTSLVNAVMAGPDWSSSAIFITHDEWGGYYDHVAPPVINGDSFGLRVASVMVSPWAKRGMIDHQVLSFDNYLKFIEDDFLNGQRLDPKTDGRPDPRPVVVENLPGVGDLINEFDFNQNPLPPLILALHPNSPTASAGGPYTITEGQALTLFAQATDPRGGPISYNWDLTNTGRFTAAQGATPILSWSQLLALGITDDGSPYQLAVLATDSAGWQDVSEFATLTVLSAAPAVRLSGMATTVEGQLYTLKLSATLSNQPDSSIIDWGDGTSTTLSGPAPQSVTHAYAAAGTYTITASVVDDGTTYSATNALMIAVADAPLRAVPVLFSPGEDVVFDGPVATFTDAAGTGSVTEYSATISWGDGSTSTGTISPNGTSGFSVTGGHTYLLAGTYSFSVFIQDAGGASALASGQTTVAILLQPAVIAPLVERSALTGLLATFVDPNGAAADYTATLSWGDGQQSAGTVAATGSNTFSVSGQHTYAAAGSYVLTLALLKQGIPASKQQISIPVIDAPLQATAIAVSAFENEPWSGVVADFQDLGSDGNPADYSATITWSDGSTSAGTISTDGSGGFNVSAGHKFTEEGNLSTGVLIADQEGSSATLAVPVAVLDAPLQPLGLTIRPTAKTAFGGVIAEFRDPGTDGTVADYATTIAWGDGTTTAGTIVHDAGGGDLYDIVGTNTYTAAGTYSVSVAVADSGGALVSVATSALVTDVGLVATSKSSSVIEGKTFTRIVADFRDLDGNDNLSDYTATISWGDGSSSTGVIAATGTGFTVTGTSSYAEEGAYALDVTIVDLAAGGSPAVTAYGTANVGDAPMNGLAKTVNSVEGAAFTGVVAGFTDSDHGGTAGDYSANIDWGDGHTSAGIITPGKTGGFTVSGSHSYTVNGSYSLNVMVQDAGGASVLVQSTALVADATLAASPVSFSSAEEAPFTATVARFSDANPSGNASAFAATINWGDGTSSGGTISADSQGGFDVMGRHTYSSNGSYSFNVNITDSGGANTTVTGSSTVSDPYLVQQPPAELFGQLGALTIATPTEGQSFTGTLATFTDPGFNGSTASYQVTIDWGDGSTSAGRVQQDAGGGDLLDVMGTHVYTRTGTYLTKNTVLDPSADSPPNKATYFGAAQVAQAALSIVPLALTPVAGVTFAGTLATFTSINPFATVAEYTAQIDWGDGQVSRGTVRASANGIIIIAAMHRYIQTGTYQLGIEIDESGYFAAEGQTSAVAGSAIVLEPGSFTAFEGVPLNGIVASSPSSDGNLAAGNYAASISWGDGSTSIGTVTSNFLGGISVLGTHTYARTGSYSLVVTLTGIGTSPVTTSTTASAIEAPLLANSTTILVANGFAANNVSVATLTDPGAEPVANYTATIDWGDGTPTTSGTISGSGITFTVSGTHAYAALGKYPIKVAISEQDGTAATALSTALVGTQNQRFVAQLYLDLLHRPVDPAGLASWTSALAQGAAHSQIALQIEGSQEYLSLVVKSFYLLYLDRTADPSGMSTWVSALASGATEQEVESALIGSPEYFDNRSGATNDGFLDAVYGDLLQRPPDSQGRQFFDQQLAMGVTRSQVAAMIFASDEYRHDLVRGYFSRFLHRATDPSGLTTFVNELGSGVTNQQVIATLVGSDEYFGRV
jgi:phospholipase C